MEVVKVKKLIPGAVLPKKAHASDAGFDLVAAWMEYDDFGNVVYGTGLAFEIPEGYVGLLFPRSSVARKQLAVANSVGVIDAGYRGEVTVKFKGMFLLGGARAEDNYRPGDRVAQLVIVKLPDVALVEADELSESERGIGGYGSTGR